MKTNTETGTIIEGTHLREDLIPRFFEVLTELDPEQAMVLRQEFSGINGCLDVDGNLITGREETAEWLLEQLFDALHQCAAPGTYFGAHVGDGSDFGFWESEDYG